MKKQFILISFLFLAVTTIFFYPLLKGQVPFPGDLLVASSPYNTNSYFGYAPGGVPNKAQGPDVIHESFPWKAFAIDSIKKGQIPFWNPHNFSGNPFLANFQSAVFYPLNILFLLFPFNFSWSVFIFLAPFLASSFMYLFLRYLQLSKTASIFGGIIFAYSSYMVVWMQYGNITHTFLWLPLALLVTGQVVNNFARKNLLFLVLILLLSLSGGYVQGFFYILVTIALYFIFQSFRTKTFTNKKFLLYIIIISSPVLLLLFQIFPTLEVFQFSSRGNYLLEQVEYLLNPVWYLITVIAPDFFGNPASRNYWFNGTYIERVSYFGLIPFIFALTALLAFRKRAEIMFFSGLFLFILIISSNILITKYIYLLPLPMLSTTVPTRALGLFEFFGAILAAFGLEFFIQKKHKSKFFIAFAAVFTILLGAFVFTFLAGKIFPSADWVANLSVSKRNLILPLAFVFAFFFFLSLRFFFDKKIKKVLFLIQVFLVVITIFDLFYFFHKITPFSPQEYIYPQTEVIENIKTRKGIDRYWGYGSAYVSSNFQTFDGTYSPDGEDPLHLKSYTKFLVASKDGKIPAQLPRPDANVAQGYGPSDLRVNEFRQKALNVLGVKYVLNKDESIKNDKKIDPAFDEKKYTLIWQEAPWQIYENLQSIPRASLYSKYEVVEDETGAVLRFYEKDFDEKTTVILDKRPEIGFSMPSKSSVDIISYQPNKVVIKTMADANTILFLSDSYYPGWKANVDGKSVKIYTANSTFRAVPLEKGVHKIEFNYVPESFNKGIVYSGIFAILLLLVIWRVGNQTHENRK